MNNAGYVGKLHARNRLSEEMVASDDKPPFEVYSFKLSIGSSADLLKKKRHRLESFVGPDLILQAAGG